MNLRDQAAISAMQGLIAGRYGMSPEDTSKTAYEYADALLSQRAEDDRANSAISEFSGKIVTKVEKNKP